MTLASPAACPSLANKQHGVSDAVQQLLDGFFRDQSASGAQHYEAVSLGEKRSRQSLGFGPREGTKMGMHAPRFEQVGRLLLQATGFFRRKSDK